MIPRNKQFVPGERKNSRCGFTLIELLVVIAIITLLVSILLPCLQGAKELARTAVCFSNLRNISLAGRLYHQDNNDRLFGGAWTAKENNYNQYYPIQSPGLRRYLGYEGASAAYMRSKDTVCTCPSAQLKAYTRTDILRQTYGQNGWTTWFYLEYNFGNPPRMTSLSDPNPSRTFASIVRPAEMGFFFDSATSSPVDDDNDFYYWEGPEQGQIHNNWWNNSPHYGEYNENVTYADGHAEGIPGEDLIADAYVWKTSPFFYGGYK